jgi:hypothetical protein
MDADVVEVLSDPIRFHPYTEGHQEETQQTVFSHKKMN